MGPSTGSFFWHLLVLLAITAGGVMVALGYVVAGLSVIAVGTALGALRWWVVAHQRAWGLRLSRMKPPSLSEEQKRNLNHLDTSDRRLRADGTREPSGQSTSA